MKFDQALIATLREDPKEAETKSHRILLRGGFIRQLASGIHTYLPLGWRVLRKIEQIVREEHERINAQELLMPALSPKEVWEQSGRWEEYGDDMFKLKDRKGRSYCLCPTHEEVITEIARAKIRSYRDLPQIWYQIQIKYRDEPRPRFGVIRARAFIMKDSYSLDKDDAGLDRSFELHRQVYMRIFKRCGIDFEVINASGGLMGTGESKEFIARVPGGEDTLVACDKCTYRSNLEAAQGKGTHYTFNDGAVSEVHTPGKRSVEEVSAFLNVPPHNLVKSMFFTASGQDPVMILLRGDYEINMAALNREIGYQYKPASADEIKSFFNAEPGFVGPYKRPDLTLYVDDLLKGCTGMITGANKNDYHIRGLNIDRDINVRRYITVRQVTAGDGCPQCEGKLVLYNCLELGHIFKLGTKYSKILNAMFLDENGSQRPIVMGSYGIGLERIMACVCEQKGDDKGAVWPISIAPYEVYCVVLNPNNEDVGQIAAQVTKALTDKGFSIIIDDRDISAGIKFNDSELLGIPLRVTIGPKGAQRKMCDVAVRETGESQEVSQDSAAAYCDDMRSMFYRRLQDAERS